METTWTQCHVQEPDLRSSELCDLQSAPSSWKQQSDDHEGVNMVSNDNQVIKGEGIHAFMLFTPISNLPSDCLTRLCHPDLVNFSFVFLPDRSGTLRGLLPLLPICCEPKMLRFSLKRTAANILDLLLMFSAATFKC